jgi:hypothetical protein
MLWLLALAGAPLLFALLQFAREWYTGNVKLKGLPGPPGSALPLVGHMLPTLKAPTNGILQMMEGLWAGMSCWIHTRTHTHTHAHTHIHTYMRTHTCTQTYTRTHSQVPFSCYLVHAHAGLKMWLVFHAEGFLLTVRCPRHLCVGVGSPVIIIVCMQPPAPPTAPSQLAL